MKWWLSVSILLFGSLVVCTAQDSEGYEDDDSAYEEPDISEETWLRMICDNPSDIMLDKPVDATDRLADDSIFLNPDNGADPNDVRIDRAGWKVDVPKSGGNHPSVVLDLTKGGREGAPLIKEMITSANGWVGLEIQRPGKTTFEPFTEAKRFEADVPVRPPVRAEKLKFTLLRPNIPGTSEYSLQLSVRACWPDRSSEDSSYSSVENSSSQYTSSDEDAK